MKTCPRCKVTKSLLEFYGGIGKCKPCAIEYTHNWKIEHRNKVKIHYQNYYNIHRIEIIQRTTNYAKQNRLKRNAAAKLGQAVTKGEILKPSNCSICNAENHICAHHPKYSKPLEVIWVCYSCHRLIHNRMVKGNIK